MAHGDAIDDLNDACEALVELSACSKVRDQTIDVQTNYSRLVTLAQGNFFFLIINIISIIIYTKQFTKTFHCQSFVCILFESI